MRVVQFLRRPIGTDLDEAFAVDCAPTVHESNVFILLGIALSEKQIPRFIGDVRGCFKTGYRALILQ